MLAALARRLLYYNISASEPAQYIFSTLFAQYSTATAQAFRQDDDRVLYGDLITPAIIVRPAGAMTRNNPIIIIRSHKFKFEIELLPIQSSFRFV